MMDNEASMPMVAIACGGTGGHLFPGLAVAAHLRDRGCAVTILISPKEVDQQAVRGAVGVKVATLPAVGLSQGGQIAFARGFVKSYRLARKSFKTERPEAVLAMGGFTSSPPILAGRRMGAPTFLHESNTIPGRANRWLSRVISQAFIGFPQAAARLHTKNVKVTGTPVRAEFQPTDPSGCRRVLGLEPDRPVLLVTGGSQGASGLNDLVIRALPSIVRLMPQIQLLHLTGPNDVQKVETAYASNKVPAVVKSFFGEMHLALGAATVAVSRAGASSLAELAAMRVPSVLVPYPAATDNHQFYNAQALEKSGAALMAQQGSADPDWLGRTVVELAQPGTARSHMQDCLAAWHAPRAADQIAEIIVQAIVARRRATGRPVSRVSADVQRHQSVVT